MKDRNTKTRSIYKSYVGSYAHGLYMSVEEFGDEATCDIDTQEFFIYPLEFYLSLDSYMTPTRKLTATEFDGANDIVRHEVRKALELLKKGNPNMLVPLFCEKNKILEMTPGGKLIRDNRHLFLAKKSIYERFNGYAFTQLDRMQKGAYRGYMGDKRKKIADKYGYDTKNAMTLIRLMHEAVEVLETANITVDKEVQGTRDYYLAIKRGNWSLEAVKKEAYELKERMEIAYRKSTLPALVDDNAIKELSIAVFRLEFNLDI